jgi:hypothetical protein
MIYSKPTSLLCVYVGVSGRNYKMLTQNREHFWSYHTSCATATLGQYLATDVCHSFISKDLNPLLRTCLHLSCIRGLNLIRHAYFSTYITRLHLECYPNPFTILSYTTPLSTVLLETPTVAQPLKKFPECYGTRMFITTLTRACHRFLSWARRI